MALYSELPVYKAAYDLLLQVFGMVHNLSKEYKYSLGEKIKNEITELLSNIYRANRSPHKNQHLEKARENLELARLYIRILKDTQQIGINKYVSINQNMEGVSKQLAGWHKSIEKPSA
ncbi:MAG TPA: four helix bundle protein [Tenuifilum sp.]|uniref:four helix bundle protein n=1 Tax=Tenuifilum sp. TaxID=2760880 RepID=UPI002C8B819D|nr:four helix bundle protein [Tenuifilum sp.]